MSVWGVAFRVTPCEWLCCGLVKSGRKYSSINNRVLQGSERLWGKKDA